MSSSSLCLELPDSTSIPENKTFKILSCYRTYKDKTSPTDEGNRPSGEGGRNFGSSRGHEESKRESTNYWEHKCNPGGSIMYH